MSEAIDDMEAYMKMNDYSIFFQILHSTEPELERSRQLLRKIQKRDLYKFIGQTQLKGDKRLIEVKSSFGPRQANLVLIAYASSEGSGEPAHPRSLARTFAARSYKQ